MVKQWRHSTPRHRVLDTMEEEIGKLSARTQKFLRPRNNFEIVDIVIIKDKETQRNRSSAARIIEWMNTAWHGRCTVIANVEMQVEI